MDISDLIVVLSLDLYGVDRDEIDSELIDDEFAELVRCWIFFHILHEIVRLFHVLVHVEGKLYME